MYSETHDYSLFNDLVEIPFGFSAASVAVTNQSQTASLEVNLDGSDDVGIVGPGADIGLSGPLSSVWIARAAGTGELLAQHVALVQGLDPPPEPTPPASPTPPPPEPEPQPNPVLELLRAQKIDSIDRRTTELIGRGFTHAGKRFSLSDRAQIKWGHAFAGAAALTAIGAFPLLINTIDDSGSHAVADAAELVQIQLAILGIGLAYLGSDAALKAEVRAATTIAEVNAVVDVRGI